MEVIFETHDRFPKKVFLGDEKILDFNRQNLNLVKDANGDLIRLKESDSWICVVTDEGRIKKIKSHPGYEKSFWEVDRVPTKRSKVTIVQSGPMVSHSQADLGQKYKRLGHLEARLILSDGTYSKNADLTLIEEYEKLKRELS